MSAETFPSIATAFCKSTLPISSAVTLQQLSAKISGANRSFQAGEVRDGGKQISLMGGQTLRAVRHRQLLRHARWPSRLCPRRRHGIVVGANPWNAAGPATSARPDGSLDRAPAVTLALAKRAGANAVVISERIIDRLRSSRAGSFPADVDVDRDAQLWRDGQREGQRAAVPPRPRDDLDRGAGRLSPSAGAKAIVVAIVIPVTILLTLFASWLMGYTHQPRQPVRADLLHRHPRRRRHRRHREHRAALGHARRPPPLQAAIDAVAEVGNPTIVATLTVVAALLPMLFVSGLMGPYMSPIPANASAAMMLVVLRRRDRHALADGTLRRQAHGAQPTTGMAAHEAAGSARSIVRVARPLLRRARPRPGCSCIVVGVATSARWRCSPPRP